MINMNENNIEIINEDINFMSMSVNDFEVLDKTFYSLQNNLLDLDLKKQTLILNIDVFPNDTNIEKNEEIANKYFGNVIINIEKECNCSKAFIWCLNNIKSKYFFIIEANKCIKKNFKMRYLIDELLKAQTSKKIASIHLSPSSKNLVLEYASTHIALWDYSYMEKILKNLSPYINYEYQLRELMLLFKWKSITIAETEEYLNHIGAEWKKEKKYVLANSSHDYEIYKILKNDNWHKNIYNEFKCRNKEDLDIKILNRFQNISINELRWMYRWTGVWKYVSLEDNDYYSRHVKKSRYWSSYKLNSFDLILGGHPFNVGTSWKANNKGITVTKKEIQFTIPFEFSDEFYEANVC